MAAECLDCHSGKVRVPQMQVDVIVTGQTLLTFQGAWCLVICVFAVYHELVVILQQLKSPLCHWLGSM